MGVSSAVLLDASVVSRGDLFRAPRHKEWWYVGWVDETRTVYMSFHAVRLPAVDNVAFTVFDLTAREPVVRSRKLFLRTPARADRTDLRAASGRVLVQYEGSYETGWRLRFADRGVEADIVIGVTAPAFTKEENQFVHHYSMLSTMHAAVSGTVTAQGRTYTFGDALGYADHCFGDVPRRTGWHWLAVQNADQAFVSLVNYGGYGQKYSQLLRTGRDGVKEWVRLSQDASFEHPPTNPGRRWRLTSCDVDLTIELLQTTQIREQLPPLVPFWVNLTHDESFVRANGRVRTERGWAPLDDTYGVLEEHHGTW